MDFFKSVFSVDPDAHTGADDKDAAEGVHGTPGGADPDPLSSGGADGESRGAGVAWGGFGGLIKTLASKSESVIHTYRRDLEEFGTGFRKETAAIREAIRDLPTSLEAGASVAQESLESVGQAIDDFGESVWRGTAEIIAQGKDALHSMDADASVDLGSSSLDTSAQSGGGGPSNRYTRFEAKVLAIQSDPSTFSEELEDTDDFRAWIVGFQLADKEAEIESLLGESRTLDGNLARLVPQVVDRETFWSRYFYKVHKLKQAEDVRANLVKRVISREEEEEDLSWEFDDDDTIEKDKKEEPKGQERGERDEPGKGGQESGVSVPEKSIVNETPHPVIEESSVKNSELEDAADTVLASSADNVRSEMTGDASEFDNREAAVKPVDKVPPEGKGETVESCKDSDVSVVSSQPSIPEEEDLGWDEIEDLGDNDERKFGVSAGSPDKIDLRKKLSAAEEDEDLSWDIEDDEPIKP